MKSKKRWFIQSVAGLLLTGTGLCMTVNACFARFAGEDWFWYGTAALLVFQAGLCLVIDGLRFRMKENF
ncbi:hypothetical protein [Algoriphagus sp. AK58]|uniref:hypothetical protein n=1 Tax=Algoriphagus sp. AK58 TaxID=1406877 RepID=UPI0016503D6B|nr:hypothetical protein [Algoriphagus sp. AK58]MBC6366696.1 hypothetical protein [Algoriphagus sp. AK58]